LSTEFERLWLKAPLGLVSKGDAEGASDLDSDEAKAHASYYAVQHGWRENTRIFLRAIRLYFRKPHPPAEETGFEGAKRFSTGKAITLK
jgi:hypothetical protein